MTRRLSHPAALAAVAALAFALSACGDDDEKAASSDAAAVEATQPAPTATTRAPAEATAGPASAGATDALPAFTAKLGDGSAFDSASIKAGTVIHVYASWCPTCKAEAPDFAEFQKQHPDLTYLYVAVEDKPADSLAFLKEYGMADGQVINDTDRDVATKLGLTGQPNTVFVPAKGDLTKILGPAGVDQLKAAAAKL